MPDPAKQLQSIYLDGFDVEKFERYVKCIGVTKGGCIALLEAGVDGLRMVGRPGWRMGEVMGVLVEVGGRDGQSFPERLPFTHSQCWCRFLRTHHVLAKAQLVW